MLKNIAQKMVDLGFTKYEALAYVSLLQNSPVTRYELSKNSGVPRSAIYDVIRRLENHGAVNVLSGTPEKYVPLPQEEFLNMLSQRYDKKIEDFKKDISKIETFIRPGQLWNITGYDHFIAKAREMINEAKSEIYISAWKREIKEVIKELKRAEKRGVRIVIFSFTKVPDIGNVYSYNLEEIELEKTWDHKLILARDREELLMGEASKKPNQQTAWTKNTAIIHIALNHIVLDITLYGQRFGEDVSESVIEMHPGEFKMLGSLLEKKLPDNAAMDLNFSKSY